MFRAHIEDTSMKVFLIISLGVSCIFLEKVSKELITALSTLSTSSLLS